MIKRFCDLCGSELLDKKSVSVHLTKPGKGVSEGYSSVSDDTCPDCITKIKEFINGIKNLQKGD
ncbi:MAG: hypothetical protein KAS32_02535 [Candidatus Peribacteraceae bacterium]|nr:hypothetical protein [Candidatus Peribacteraceae bacterium]